ncbi:hypothetical protein [Pilimelia terevasa]|nr:hypothetical protein [Pilimelia terevasa]
MTTHATPRTRVHYRLVGEVPIAPDHAEVTRVRISIQQYPGATEPVVALRADGVLDFGRRALRRLNVLLAEAERLIRS